MENQTRNNKPLLISTWLAICIMIIVNFPGAFIFSPELNLSWLSDNPIVGLIYLLQFLVVPCLSILNIILGSTLLIKQAKKQELISGIFSLIIGLMGILWGATWWLFIIQNE